MNLTMILSFGHDEYTLQADGLTLHQIWAPMAGDDDDIMNDDDVARASFVEHLGESAAAAAGDICFSWENVYRVSGDRLAFVQALDTLIGELSVTPSGDDDSFDYWPSGVRLAYALALKLGDDVRLEKLRQAVAGAFIDGYDDEIGAWNPAAVNLGGLELEVDAEKLDADISALTEAGKLNEADALRELRSTGSADAEEVVHARVWAQALEVDALAAATNARVLETFGEVREPLSTSLLDMSGEVEVYRAGRPLGTLLPLCGLRGGAWRAFPLGQDPQTVPAMPHAFGALVEALEVTRNADGSFHVEGRRPEDGAWVDVDIDSDDELVAFLTVLGAPTFALLAHLFKADHDALGGGFIEARCTTCSQTFLPHDGLDFEHGECGGAGIIQGSWTRG